MAALSSPGVGIEPALLIAARRLGDFEVSRRPDGFAVDCRRCGGGFLLSGRDIAAAQFNPVRLVEPFENHVCPPPPAPAQSAAPPRRTAEDWLRELDRRCMGDLNGNFGKTVLQLFGEMLASERAAGAADAEAEARRKSERSYMMNPEGANSDDSTTRRFALLEIDEE